MPTPTWKTVEEAERDLGEQVRTRRLRADRTAQDVATEAGVSTKTVLNLERGQGSTITSLVKVLRALGADDWLETLTPPEVVSPIAVVESARRADRPRRRAGRSRG